MFQEIASLIPETTIYFVRAKIMILLFGAEREIFILFNNIFEQSSK